MTGKTSIDLPFTPEEVRDGTARERLRLEAWDRWYASLPSDLRQKLSIYDFKRLGDCFKIAFGIG